ncbi:threonine/serine dehydratase [Robbsia sp. Bb-Pol-6]|uniref:Threonine/serine dehydratase n=1 Tax=Robbsia betulipollinis TaxID=2981849 RepID=A0ABT3ZIH0_9BURK|nr:threonine/serine dehydratase [Robbsia betulipollinis]MCY0386162.1 threonine/serine dehydratase [Robbsia betulipollinis]
MSMQYLTPTAADVRDAAERLAGVAIHTPIVRSDRLDALTGARVFVKLESLQHTAAFKFRGAYNALSRLDRASCPDGVVAYSTGNHGQAIATVGRLLGIPTTVVMPSNAPANKIKKAETQGARIVLYDRDRQSREDVAAELARQGRFAVVPPGDHHHVIAGQGTVAFESLDVLGADRPDMIIVPCGGGGLSAGTCLAVEAAGARAQVWAAEPARFDDTRRSLCSGKRETNAATTPPSICDALLAPTPAELPFSINRQRLSGVLVADDTAVMAAMRLCFEAFRTVVEPGGAVALAALLSDPGAPVRGKTVLVIASGGNVEASLFAQAIALPPA